MSIYRASFEEYFARTVVICRTTMVNKVQFAIAVIIFGAIKMSVRVCLKCFPFVFTEGRRLITVSTRMGRERDDFNCKWIRSKL